MTSIKECRKKFTNQITNKPPKNKNKLMTSPKFITYIKEKIIKKDPFLAETGKLFMPIPSTGPTPSQIPVPIIFSIHSGNC